MRKPERPGLARTDRGVSRPLRAWLARAVNDHDALEALALAWSGHSAAERQQLVALFWRDLRAEGADLEPARHLFRTMLALEEDLGVVVDILAVLTEMRPDHAAFVQGHAEEGAAVLARDVCEGTRELFGIRWREGVAERVACEVLDEAELRPRLARFFGEPAWTEVSPTEACDRFALPLLRYTRAGGALPEGCERFASVITGG